MKMHQSIAQPPRSHKPQREGRIVWEEEDLICVIYVDIYVYGLHV